jgi:hypothetical protein
VKFSKSNLYDHLRREVLKQMSVSTFSCAGFVRQRRGKKVPSFIKQKIGLIDGILFSLF